MTTEGFFWAGGIVLAAGMVVLNNVTGTDPLEDEKTAQREVIENLNQQIEVLSNKQDSLDAQAQGTFDYLILQAGELLQQAEETDAQFEELAAEDEKTRGLISGIALIGQVMEATR